MTGRQVRTLRVDCAVYHIASLAHAKMPGNGARIDEPHVIVAIGRMKAPRARSGFDGKQDQNILFCRQGGKPCFDLDRHIGADGVIGSRCHVTAMTPATPISKSPDVTFMRRNAD